MHKNRNYHFLIYTLIALAILQSRAISAQNQQTGETSLVGKIYEANVVVRCH